jgi:hypothetical protein
MSWIAAAIAVTCAAWLGGPLAAARADGDPASDVLVAAPPLFLSVDSGATYGQKLALQGQLRRAAEHGFALRVAVIATRSDLGSVTALWGHPETYAEFLGRELSLDYHGELLVVMPDGFGVTRDGAPVRSPLGGLAPRHGELLTASEQAVARLTGVPVAGAAVARVAAAPSRTSGIGWWASTAIALAAIALAWTASLRRRPLRGRRRLADPSAG